MEKRIGILIDAVARVQHLSRLVQMLRQTKENALGASESLLTLQQRLEGMRTASTAFQHMNLAGAEAVYIGRKFSQSFLGLARSTLSAYAELERYQITLQTVEKSTERAARTLAWAKEFAATTPFELKDVIGATVVFRNMGLSAQRWLRVAGDMAAAMGVNILDASYAVARAAASGAEGMMALTRTFGITSDMLKQFGWTGKGSMEQFRKALETLLKTRFEGGMARFMNTMGGVLSNLRDIFWNFRTEIGKPIDAFLTGVLKRLLSLLDQLQKTGKLTAWARAISEGFLSVLRPAVRLAEALGRLLAPLWTFLMTHPIALKLAITVGLLSSAFLMLGGTLLFFGGMAGQAVLGLRTLGLMLSDFTLRGILLRGTLGSLKAAFQTLLWPLIAPLKMLRGLFLGLAGAITSVSWPLLLIAGLVALLGAVIVTAWIQNWGNLREKTLRILRTLWKALKTGIYFLIGLFKALAPVLGNIARKLLWVWLQVSKRLFETMMIAVRWVARAFSWLWQKAIRPVLERITGALARILEGAARFPGLHWAKGAAEQARALQRMLRGEGTGPTWLATVQALIEEGRASLSGVKAGQLLPSMGSRAVLGQIQGITRPVARAPLLPQPQPVLAGASPTVNNHYYTVHYERDSIQVRILSPDPGSLREQIRRIFEEEVLQRW